MKEVSYKQSGVDLRFANAIVPRIRDIVKIAKRPEVLADIGPFGALFRLKKYKEPILVSSADGVGTKLLMAMKLKQFESAGIDLVAMNVNDILAMGAEPLFFLDYIGIGKGQKAIVPELIRGMAHGCKTAGCALVGGEVAEMPTVYGGMRLGFSGFAVGAAEKRKIIDGRKIGDGDVVLGLASSGLHANGFSLINKVFRPRLEFLTPTRIYVKSILEILNRFEVHGLAHITGGGLYDNVRRILPQLLEVRIQKATWPRPSIFYDIKRRSGLDERGMFHAFNMGIGFALVVPPRHAENIIRRLSGQEKVFRIGYVRKGRGGVIIE